MDYLREMIMSGKVKLIEWVCEDCGLWFQTGQGGNYECPACHGDVNINSIYSGDYDGREEEKPNHE